MNTKITREPLRSTTGDSNSIYVLWETARDDTNEPWIAIMDSKDRTKVAAYQRWLELNGAKR